MNTSDSIFEKTYPINSLNIDTNKRLSLFGLLGILQDAAWEHASMLGFGYEDIMEEGFFWALIRLKLKMESWPKWHQQITLKTWTLPVSGIYAIREFELFVGGQKTGACSSTWVILDSDSRKPKMIQKADLLYRPRTDHSVGFSAQKIVVPVQMRPFNRFDVKNSDLDANHHANNVKYAQWMLDTIPFTTYLKLKIRSYEINFLAEAFPGDQVEILSDADTGSMSIRSEVYYQGRRVVDDKTVFISRMLI